MTLNEYLKTLPSGGQAKFAKEIGVTHTYLSQLSGAQDGRVPSPALSLVIWNKSKKAVTRQELRPKDFWLIWPDLAHLKPKVEVNAGNAIGYNALKPPIQIPVSGEV